MTTKGSLPEPRVAWLTFCGTLVLVATNFAGAQTESIIYAFYGGQPYGSVVADTSGDLYGTTYSGGTNSFGTVYKLTPPAAHGVAWIKTILYSFGPGIDGRYPYGPLLLNTKSHKIYGTTYAGGRTTLARFTN